jgi:hypothetical protein
MAANGVLGNGVKVAYSASSPVSWTAVAQLDDVEIPGLIADKIDTSTHASLYKRKMRGMLDVSTMKLMLLSDLDGSTTPSHVALQALQVAGTTVWWRVEVPVNRAKTLFVAFEFQAYVNGWSPKAPKADKQIIDVEVEFDDTSFSRYAAAASAIS